MVKSRHKTDLLVAYKKVYSWYEVRGYKPTLHSIDSKMSAEVVDFIASQRTNLQYSAPGRHYQPAERAVQTYKSYFKSMLASLSPSFPIRL